MPGRKKNWTRRWHRRRRAFLTGELIRWDLYTILVACVIRIYTATVKRKYNISREEFQIEALTFNNEVFQTNGL